MIQAADVAAARRESLGLILQRRLSAAGGLVPLGFVVQLDLVAVRILAQERGSVAQVAIGPAEASSVPFRAATRRSRACGLRARNPMWPIPGCLAAVSFSVWRS